MYIYFYLSVWFLFSSFPSFFFVIRTHFFFSMGGKYWWKCIVRYDITEVFEEMILITCQQLVFRNWKECVFIDKDKTSIRPIPYPISIYIIMPLNSSWMKTFSITILCCLCSTNSVFPASCFYHFLSLRIFWLYNHSSV